MATGKICRIKDCTNVLGKTSGQICQAHRSRWFRHKDYNISPNWTVLKKGQPCPAKSGYIRVNINGKRILQHRYIMEQHLGRALNHSERVHHKNHNKADNRIENLELMKDSAEHMKTHHSDMWKRRKTRPAYDGKTIEKVIARTSAPSPTFTECFCGGKYFGRNLCSKHYQWAYDHSFT